MADDLGTSLGNFYDLFLGANVDGMKTGRVVNRNTGDIFKRIKN